MFRFSSGEIATRGHHQYDNQNLLAKQRRCVVSQSYFTTQHPAFVRKITKKKIKRILKQLDKGTPVKEIVAVIRVTPKRIYQIKKQFEETGKIPKFKQAGRKPKPLTK